MPLDSRAAFKAAFLMKCASDGLSPQDTRQCVLFILKRADIFEALGKGAAGLTDMAMKAPIVAGGIAGVGLGVGAHMLTAPQLDVDEAKRDELIAAYRTNTDRIRAREKAKQMAADALKGSR